MKTYLIFVVQAYNVQEGEILKETTGVEVIAKTADEAIAKARKIIKKKFYYIKDVIEKPC